MLLNDVLDRLDYTTSRNFLAGDELRCAPDYGHVFRQAIDGPCSLRGVYSLRDPRGRGGTPIVPVVYVCEAASEDDADAIHRLVWNQDVAPFVLVVGPATLRLYCGFRYRPRDQAANRGILPVLADLDEIAQSIGDFRAEAIDDGRLWREWGSEVTPQHRVHWELLRNLQELDTWLQTEGGLTKEPAHSLIGKYVYLHYLRDRKILSPRKLQKWNIPQQDVFGRTATIEGLRELTTRLDEWLNGRVFPIDFDRRSGLKPRHLTRVAGTFAGDELQDDGRRQLYLDFQRYDFSYIPIETLSVIYEQFLHTPEPDGKKSKGKEAGAYYTPIPVVNLMLAEMEDRLPLKRGMKVADFSCGSGAFLVQAYRRLIEKEFPPDCKPKPRPRQLRELLEKHIFGVDRDPDACSVAELSLILTLLDYVKPRDLEDGQRAKLPVLRDRNIFCSDFFDDGHPWHAQLTRNTCDWVVGNPPWKKLNPKKLKPEDRLAWAWIKDKQGDMPVGGNQLGRAFAWRVGQYLAPGGQAAMLLPAMTLFESSAKRFRAEFFRRMKVTAVANFANLAEVLFAGRSRVPAAGVFYEPRPEGELDLVEDEYISIYSPLVANQEPTRPVSENKRQQTWSLVINGSEIRDVPLGEVASGDRLPWKLATWGSHFDKRLLARLSKRFGSIEELEKQNVLIVSQGLELRAPPGGDDAEELEYLEEVVGKKKLDTKALEGMRRLFILPPGSVKELDPRHAHVRKGRGALPLSVCVGPHVIVSAARNFAIYTEEYLIVPPRQIGIVSTSEDKDFLKALSLYLSSDFAFYHQFLTSTSFGVKREIATLAALRTIPIPLRELTPARLRDWSHLHARLVAASRTMLAAKENAETPLLSEATDSGDMDDLLGELNTLVNDALGLDQRERALVDDFVHVRLELADGKVGEPAGRVPSGPEIRTYASELKRGLDAFVGDVLPKRHAIAVVYDDLSAMVRIDFTKDASAARKITVFRAGRREAAQLEKTRKRLRTERAQWVYFDRNLRIYEGTRTYIMKPMQRFHWTRSQAMVDASEVIAETLAGGGNEH